MKEAVTSFILALRDAGIRISLAESLDAYQALSIIGLSDKELFKNALNTALIKSVSDKEIFDKFFDIYFTCGTFPEKSALKEMPEGFDFSSLSQMLLSGDNYGITALLQEASRETNLGEMQFISQQGMFTNLILEKMHVEDLDRDISDLKKEQKKENEEILFELEKKRRELFAHVNEYVAKYSELYNKKKNRVKTENRLQTTSFSNVERMEMDEMKKIIQKLSRRLYTLYSRKSKVYKKGVLDIRKTIRRNSAYQGFLFVPEWKYKKVSKPEVFVICDISKSVREVSHFMLLFLYTLNKTLVKIRSFVLCSNLVEVTNIFAKYSGEEALERIYKGEGLDIMLGATDYGRSFLDFKENCLGVVRNTSTILIMGDARNNEGDPQLKAFKEISEKCKTLIWLNPERRPMWCTGDSVMEEYLPYCDIAEECNTLSGLSKVVEKIVKG